jgi:hypothetical protein
MDLGNLCLLKGLGVRWNTKRGDEIAISDIPLF